MYCIKLFMYIIKGLKMARNIWFIHVLLWAYCGDFYKELFIHFS